MKVEVVPYDPSWPALFEKEAAALRSILGETLIEVHHIGSTSVPGLAAKPIIDIILEVSDLDELDAKGGQMEQLGYEVMGEYGIPRRRYFRKGGERRTHHVHSFVAGDEHVTRHLAFRDYLRAYPEIAADYAQVKQQAAERSNNDIEEYCDAKDPFVKEYEQKALAWLQAQ